MLRYRIIPVLLLKGDGLVKTVQFKNPKYIGDPINAVKIFNEKEVDELLIYDILATKNRQEIRYSKIEEIVSEAFMPVGYGGGIHSLTQIEKLFSLGVEKVVLNSAAHLNRNLITQAAQVYGSQSIIVAVDVKRDLFGTYRMHYNSGIEKSSTELKNALKQFVELGAGEIIINSIDRDGSMRGYDLDLIKLANEAVTVPLVACGGAGDVNHFAHAIKAGASAVAAGSMFVFHGKHRAVLISYPKYSELEDKLN
jgi:imidazole glycerol-phosphate synthase subunit HisF